MYGIYILYFIIILNFDAWLYYMCVFNFHIH